VTYNGPTATFTDTLPDPASSFTATINWGDGTTTPGAVTGPPGGPFVVSGSHAYADDGTFTVTTTLNGPAAGQSFTATSTATSTERTISSTGGFSFSSGTLTNATVATFTDPNTLAVAGDYTASINWGDTTSSAGTVSGGSGSFTVKGSHTYTAGGPHTITVTIHDADGGQPDQTVTDSQTTPADQAITASGSNVFPTEGANTGTVQTATFSDPDGASTAGEYTATITWGDGSGTFTGTVTGAAGSFAVTGNHTYAEEGTYTVTTVITDADNGANTQTVTSGAFVSDAGLTSAGLTAKTTSTTFTGSVATFQDANLSATTADFTAGGGSTTIDWGDGTSGPGTVTANGGGSFTVSGTHTYAIRGFHTVTVTIHDDGGSTTTATSSIGSGCSMFGGC
jgi:hypothetical protein